AAAMDDDARSPRPQFESDGLADAACGTCDHCPHPGQRPRSGRLPLEPVPQFSDRTTKKWVPGFRGNFNQRQKNEGAPVQALVRHGQIWGMKDRSARKQQAEIDSARPKTPPAYPPQPFLDLQKNLK